MGVSLPSGSKISIFVPNNKKAWDRQLNEKLKLITYERFSGSAHQRRIKFRARARQGFLSVVGKGKWVAIPAKPLTN